MIPEAAAMFALLAHMIEKRRAAKKNKRLSAVIVPFPAR